MDLRKRWLAVQQGVSTNDLPGVAGVRWSKVVLHHAIDMAFCRMGMWPTAELRGTVQAEAWADWGHTQVCWKRPGPGPQVTRAIGALRI